MSWPQAAEYSKITNKQKGSRPKIGEEAPRFEESDSRQYLSLARSHAV
jgi:hypothetical protein